MPKLTPEEINERYKSLKPYEKWSREGNRLKQNPKKVEYLKKSHVEKVLNELLDEKVTLTELKDFWRNRMFKL